MSKKGTKMWAGMKLRPTSEVFDILETEIRRARESDDQEQEMFLVNARAILKGVTQGVRS